MANQAQGIDVSHFQGNVNWGKVAQSGIAFAFAKATDGNANVDSTFKTNWNGIAAAGIVRGAYHFFRAGVDAKQQALHFAQAVGPLASSDLPPVLDLEDRAGITANGVSNASLINSVAAFISVIEDKMGISPIIYTDPSFWKEHMDSSFGNYTLWIANYNVAKPIIPAGWHAYTFWQFSDHGSVPGIAGNVDMDHFNGTVDDLQAFIGGTAPAGNGSSSGDGGGSSSSGGNGSGGGDTGGGAQTYTVKAGDTLSSISRKVGVSVQDIADANGISDPSKIQVGQVLNLS